MGWGYVRDDGHAQAACTMYARRQLSKRLNTVCWLLGQPPMFYPNASTFDLSFKQKMIAIEGEAYIWTADGSIFDGFEPEVFRAKVASRAQAVHIVTGHESRFENYAGTSHRPVRSVIGLSLLFDVGCSRLMDRETGDKILTLLDKEIGLFSAERQAEFVPYWDDGDLVSFAAAEKAGYRKAAPKGGYASLYRQPGKALIWLVNSAGEGQSLDLWVDDQKLLGKPAKTLRDAETGELMIRLKPNDKDPLQQNVWPHVYVPAQTFRALIME